MELANNTCKYCGKHYTRTGYLNRHEINCMMVRQVMKKSVSVDKADIEEEEDVIPISVMNKIVNELVIKMMKMEEDITMLKKWAKKEKISVNILEWLSEHESPRTTFKEWYKSLNINRYHLELVFKYDFVRAFPYIIENLIDIESIKELPIKSFEQKANIFYVFDEERKWSLLTSQDMNKFVDTIQNKIIVENINWQKENKRMLEDDNLAREYMENNLKVLASKYDPDYAVNQIKNKLFNYIKYNLNSIQEYEFTF